MAKGRAHTLADGQVAATATALVSGSDIGGGLVTITLANTSSSTTETVTLTFQRAGGTSRRIHREVMDPNETFVLSNLPMEADDTLLGATTTASTVDYMVYRSSGGPLGRQGYDEDGAPKKAVGLIDQLELINS